MQRITIKNWIELFAWETSTRDGARHLGAPHLTNLNTATPSMPICDDCLVHHKWTDNWSEKTFKLQSDSLLWHYVSRNTRAFTSGTHHCYLAQNRTQSLHTLFTDQRLIVQVKDYEILWKQNTREKSIAVCKPFWAILRLLYCRYEPAIFKHIHRNA
jgi:hypothetical protein